MGTHPEGRRSLRRYAPVTVSARDVGEFLRVELGDSLAASESLRT
jgi:hypothetical protein